MEPGHVAEDQRRVFTQYILTGGMVLVQTVILIRTPPRAKKYIHARSTVNLGFLRCILRRDFSLGEV